MNMERSDSQKDISMKIRSTLVDCVKKREEIMKSEGLTPGCRGCAPSEDASQPSLPDQD